MRAKILAIDPGTNELGLYDGRRSCTLSVSGKKMPVAERWAELGVKLTDFLAEHGPYDFVVYEEQFSRGDAATRALYGMVGIIVCTAVNSGAGTMPIPQPTLRSWLALEDGGEKRMNREQAKGRIRNLMRCAHGLEFETQDEYDAAFIYTFAREKGIVS